MAVHIDVALDIDEAMMERVHLRDKERQRPQARVLSGKQLARAGVEMPLRRGIHLVTERARLRIEIGEVDKRAAAKKLWSMK